MTMITATPDHQASLYVRRVMNNAVQVAPDEQIELVLRVQTDPDDQEAKRLLVDNFVRLVMKVAVGYSGMGVPLDDLIQEGVIGLFRAAGKFEPERGCCFSTYATHWIRQAVSRYVKDNQRTIRLPVHRGDQIMRVAKLQTRMAQKLGRNPTDRELEKATKEQERTLAGLTAAELLALRHQPLSLDHPCLADSDDSLGDFIPENAPSPADFAASEELRQALAIIIDEWEDEREQDIVRMYFGLEPYGAGRTLEEIGEVYGITRERIRQIKAVAMARFRHPRNMRRLRAFL